MQDRTPVVADDEKKAVQEHQNESVGTVKKSIAAQWTLAMVSEERQPIASQNLDLSELAGSHRETPPFREIENPA